MKKETINTFDGGMIRDLHPLTTPNNVLTDALNATLITYNGNENILQNDIGNVKIKDALLKSGYVPVGMKEHGGIIYVAAYNPETMKGQLGSFPSPQQLWEDVNWTVNTPPTFITTPSIPASFYSGDFIQVETVKQELFTNQNGEARKFYPGDRFVIQFPVSSLSTYVGNGWVSVQLGVIKSDGGIEIMRTWSDESPNTFLYSGGGSLTTIVKGPDAQVFDASSSGQLILIVNLHTLDTFNLIREYSLDGENIKVTFTGEGTKNGETMHSLDNGYLQLSDGTNVDQDKIEVSGQTGTVTKMIYPNVPFGIVQRMGRQVKVNFDKIKSDQDEFGEWRFFVTPTYVKIGWSYDFYNLDGKKEIEYIRMYFHPLENGYDANHGVAVKRVDFQREYYNGNFEDYVSYKDIGLQYRRVYIVEIVKKLKGVDNEQIITFKMLYLSRLYNSNYNGFYVNNAIGTSSGDVTYANSETPEFQRITVPALGIKLNSESNITVKDSKTKIKQPGESVLGHETDTGKVKSNLFTKELTKTDFETIDSAESDDNKQFLTQIKNTYNTSFKLKGELEGIDEDYIGQPRLDLFTELMQTYSIQSITVESSIAGGTKKWLNSTETIQFPTVTTSGENVQDPACEVNASSNWTITKNNGEFSATGIEFNDYRLIQGLMSELQSTQFETRGLKPLYSPDYTPSKKKKIAPYWDQENECLCISGAGDGDYKSIHYNSTLVKGGYIKEGPDAGGGCDDGGLYTAANLMNNPMTSIFGGDHGEDAELTFDNLRENNYVLSNGHTPMATNEMDFISSETDNGGNEICHQDDNFLLACWRFTDGDTRFVNLGTPRVPWNSNTSKENFLKSTTRWPRLDVILRCILSQIFVVNRVTKSAFYVAPNENYYRYQEGTTKIKIKLTQNTSSINDVVSDIMVSEVEGKEGHTLNYYFENEWAALASQYNIINLIPQISASLPSIAEDIEIEVPNYYNLDVLLGYYLGVTFKYYDAEGEDLDIHAIYGLDTSQDGTATNALACDSSVDGKPKSHLDGAYKWIGAPKCIKVTGTLNIYRWDYATALTPEIVTFPNFGTMFTTRAKINDWADIPDNEDNEVYAELSEYVTSGNWTDGGVDENAPDMYYKVLYSPEISPLKNTTG